LLHKNLESLYSWEKRLSQKKNKIDNIEKSTVQKIETKTDSTEKDCTTNREWNWFNKTRSKIESEINSAKTNVTPKNWEWKRFHRK
jgi:hypothetical protein